MILSRRRIIGLACIAILLLIIAFGVTKIVQQLSDKAAQQTTLPHRAVLHIADRDLTVEVAQTSAERERGLGGRTSLAQDAGMLFVFQNPARYGFWMKDTLIPLDMIWIDRDGKIVDLVQDVQPDSYPTVYTPKSPAQYVLEVNAGFARRYGIVADQAVILPEGY